MIAENIAKTFSYRRFEVVSGVPAADDFEEIWPTLFCEPEVGEHINPFYRPFQIKPKTLLSMLRLEAKLVFLLKCYLVNPALICTGFKTPFTECTFPFV